MSASVNLIIYSMYLVVCLFLFLRVGAKRWHPSVLPRVISFLFNPFSLFSLFLFLFFSFSLSLSFSFSFSLSLFFYAEHIKKYIQYLERDGGFCNRKEPKHKSAIWKFKVSKSLVI